jgi:hypothetical protein
MRVVVSLTTIPSRESCVLKTIESLKKGVLQPDEIHVNVPRWYPKFKCAPSREFIEKLQGVTVNLCDDYGSLTKLIPIVEKEKDSLVILVDDDAYYSKYLVQELVNGYKEFGCAVGFSGILYPDTVRRLSGTVRHGVIYGHGNDTEMLECAFGFLIPMKDIKLYDIPPMTKPDPVYFSDDYMWSRLLDRKKVVQYKHIGRYGDDWSSIKTETSDNQMHALSRDGDNLQNYLWCRDHPWFNRPTELLISSENFAKKCDLVLCHLSFGSKVAFKNPKRVYVSGERFIFEQNLEMLKSFDTKYELVYHCSDPSFDRYKLEAIKPYVTKIYAENCDIDHPMVTKIPLGFVNGNYPKKAKVKKDIKCYLNLGLYNDKEIQFINCRSLRLDCLRTLKSKSFVTHEENVPNDHFVEMMNRSMYVVCPMGFGIDTHRFYEACYLGCTPIVMSSGLDDMYKKFGALIVNSWDDISEEILNNEINIVDEKLFSINYWIQINF